MRLWKNSKYIKKGDIFIVDKDNKKYVDEAIKKGAKLVVTQTDEVYNVKTIKVKSVNEYIKNYYNFSNIKIIGVTGTNGKTTTCYLIYQMLNFLGVKTSYIGTLGFYIDDKKITLDNTTPSIDILYNLIMDAKDEGCSFVVMEVSSHALKQKRVYGLIFDAIVVTNVTEDHLDYHKNMNDYILSKRKLIYMLKNKKICILNKYDKYYKKFIKKENQNYILGKNIKIKKINTNLNSTDITFKDNKKYYIKTNLIGDFNVYNFLMAYKVVKELGYDYKKILSNALIFNVPNGRMQKINYKKSVIFIDYAHTPDAVLKVLKTVRKIKKKRIITIIGCGGNREKEKRPIMGLVATKYSSHVIFTNDNPRYENPKTIINDIIKSAKKNYEVIYDRKEAIKKGISMLKEKDILMILGKGHEEYQIIGDNKYYFSDLKTTREIISNYIEEE